MSLKHKVSEMIAGKLPAKGNRLNNGIVASGLRQRPQMQQIVDYLNFGQEKMQVPDREAKQIRNHPFMTQLDFFDMQEDQEKQWEEQKKQHKAMELARTLGMSAAQFQATRQPIALPDRDRNAGGGGGGGGGQSSGAASSSGYGRGQPPIQRSRGGVPLEAIEDGRPRYDPYASPRRGTSQMTWTMPANVARELWTQDVQMTNGGTAIDDDATDRVAQARQNEDAQRQARQQMASFMLSSPFQPVQQSSVVNITDNQGRTIGTMPSRDDQVKARLVAHNMGTATEVMDARAQAAQNMARIAEVQLSSAPAAAPSNYDQLQSAVKSQPTGTKKTPITNKSNFTPLENSVIAKQVNRSVESTAPVYPKAKPAGPIYPKAKPAGPVLKSKTKVIEHKPSRKVPVKKVFDKVVGSKAKAANVSSARLHKFAKQYAAAM